MERIWLLIGALAGLTAVAMAAYAAHGLPGRIDAVAMGQVQQAIEMQVLHAPALLATALWAPRGGRLAQLAGLAFSLGLFGFCAGVYSVALAGVRLGSLAPAGGTLLMLGWVLLGASALRAR